MFSFKLRFFCQNANPKNFQKIRLRMYQSSLKDRIQNSKFKSCLVLICLRYAAQVAAIFIQLIVFFLFEYFSPSRLLFFVSTKASRLAWELLRHIPCFPSFALFCDSNFCRSSCFSSFAVAVFLLLKTPIQQGGEDQAWDLLRRIGL